MTTAANVKRPEGSHWYYTDGRPCYELAKKDGSGMKAPTLADARKLNLLPSVTNILKVLHKEGLVNWMIEQACLAVLTTPRKPDEPLDAFVVRVLQEEKVQEEEAAIARDKGTDIHDAMEALASGREVVPALLPWVKPAWEFLKTIGTPMLTETVVIGEGYAGKLDLSLADTSVMHNEVVEWVIDYKTTKKLPDKGSWDEHRLQLAAYAKARAYNTVAKIKTANVYISTVDEGRFKFFDNGEWLSDYESGFKPLVTYWQHSKQYRAIQ